MNLAIIDRSVVNKARASAQRCADDAHPFIETETIRTTAAGGKRARRNDGRRVLDQMTPATYKLYIE